MTYFKKSPTAIKMEKLAAQIEPYGEEHPHLRIITRPLARLLMPDPYNPASYLTPIGVSLAGKYNFWKAVQKALSEQRNVYYGYHATYEPKALLERGIKAPIGGHELWKGKAFYAAGDPFMALTQRTSQPYVPPREPLGFKSKSGVVRMVLAPEQTFVIEEPKLREFFEKTLRAARLPEGSKFDVMSDLMRKLGEMTKITQADLSWFPSGKAVEYLVRDPSIVRAMSFRNLSPESFPTEMVLPKSFSQMSGEVSLTHHRFVESEVFKDLYDKLKSLGRIERRVQELGLSPPPEWTAGDVKAKLFGRTYRPKNLTQIIDDVIASYQAGLEIPPVWKKPGAVLTPHKWWPGEELNIPSKIGTYKPFGKVGDNKYVEELIKKHSTTWGPEHDKAAELFLHGIQSKESFTKAVEDLSEKYLKSIKPYTPSFMKEKPSWLIKAYPDPKEQEILMSTFGEKINKVTLGELEKAIKKAKTSPIKSWKELPPEHTPSKLELTAGPAKWNEKTQSYEFIHPSEVHKGEFPKGSPIPLTPTQHSLLKQIFGEDLEHTSTPTLQKALKEAQNFPVSYSMGELTEHGLQQVHKSLGMTPKNIGGKVSLKSPPIFEKPLPPPTTFTDVADLKTAMAYFTPTEIAEMKVKAGSPKAFQQMLFDEFQRAKKGYLSTSTLPEKEMGFTMADIVNEFEIKFGNLSAKQTYVVKQLERGQAPLMKKKYPKTMKELKEMGFLDYAKKYGGF